MVTALGQGQAFWVEEAFRGGLRPVMLAAPEPGPGHVLVETMFSGLSRGTESLVFRGGVPISQHQAMRCPFQEGDFPAPVKYGYAAVGRVLGGGDGLVGRPVFVLHPHQTHFIVPATAAIPLPEGLPPGRAVLAANMETAINGVWDAGIAPGDRVCVIGAGVVGLLVAALASRMPGVSVVVHDIDGGKAAPTSAIDPAPVMRPIEGGKTAPATDATPVMRPLPEGKAAPAAVADKAPVMRPIEGTKPAPGAVTDPAPVMRPIDGTAPKGAIPVAADVSQPEVHDLAPKPAAPPQPKAADAKVAAPEAQVAAAEALAAPVAAKARSAGATAPASIETRSETAGTAPVAATATETRTAVQPVHAAPALVQPLAAPAGVPVQNVAAALSQQVLDMSGGDAWIDQIARDISQTAGKDGTMRFRLAPETLGDLKVEITHSERGAHVRLNVSSEAAQQALAAAEHRLTAEARAQGVRIADTEINFTGGQSRDASAQAHAREQGQQQAQANHQPRTPRGTSANSFTSSAAAPEGRGRTDRYA